MLKRLKYWWFRHRMEIPHPDEIRDFMPLNMSAAFELVAKFYGLYGMSLDEIVSHLNSRPKLTKEQVPNLALRLLYNRCSKERIRQMLWKIWRIKRCGS